VFKKKKEKARELDGGEKFFPFPFLLFFFFWERGSLFIIMEL
jgi:hypothetical protein